MNQAEEGERLETLWNAFVDWRRETTPGSYFGLSLGDIYADDVEDEDVASGTEGVRWRAELGARYERQCLDDRDDETDSILGSARLLYRFARSFELEAGYVFDRADGVRTRLVGDALEREAVDVTKNRFTPGVRWAPRSRASRDLTIEPMSLLR